MGGQILLKKRYLFLIMLVFLFVVSAVSAEEIGNETDNILSIDNDDSTELNTEETNHVLNAKPDGSFTDLANEIANAKGELNLTRNYIYNDGDLNYKDGIPVGKYLFDGDGFTINGNNHIIDGNGISTIFRVLYCNICIKNINFVNGNTSYNGVINFYSDNISVINCNFINNSASCGGAVYIGNVFNIKFINCNFINNSASCGGAGYIDESSSIVFSNSSFINNSASCGGAIYSYPNGMYCDYIIKDNSSFINNNADYGSSIFISSAHNFYHPYVDVKIFDSYFYTIDNVELIYFEEDAYGKMFLNNNTMISPISYKIYFKDRTSEIYSNKYLILENVTSYKNKPFEVLTFVDDNYNKIRLDEKIPVTLIDLNNEFLSAEFDATFNSSSGGYYISCNKPGIYKAWVKSSFIINATVIPSIIHINELSNIVISAPEVVKYYNGPERFVVTLTDDNDNPLTNQSISITINGRTYVRTTDDNGIVSLDLGLSSGDYDVVVNYEDINVTSKVTVLSTINGNDLVKMYKNDTQYYATFLDSEGNYLAKNTRVEFYLNGIFYGQKIIDNKGIAKLDINQQPGEYILTAINPVTSENVDNTIIVLPTIVENNDLAKYYNESTKFSVRVLSPTGNPASGVKVKFIIQDNVYEATSNSNGYVFLDTVLQPGKYVVTTSYNDLDVNNTIVIFPTLVDKDMKISSPDIYVGENEVIKVILPKNATGTVSTIINSKEYLANVNNGVGNIVILDLCHDYYDIDIIYSGDYQYNSLRGNTSFLVNKISDYNITAENLTIYGDQSAEIVVNVPSDATGNIVLYILSEEYVLPVIDGKATFVISDLSGHSMCGFIAVLMDDPKYELNSVYGTITILPKVSNYTISSPNVDVYCGETANITVYLPQDATGRLKVWYDGRDIGYAYINEGVATFEATYQISCVHTYDFYYEGDYKYIPKSTSVILTVHKFSDYSFNTTDVYITTGETANVIANLPKDTSGTANIRVFNENFEYTDSTTVNEGQIIFNIDGLLKDAEFIIDYLGDYRYESKSVSGSIFVKSSIVINAPDVTKYYGGSEKFIVTLTDKNNPISNADVDITIGGETITRTTDSNGKIFVDLNQNRGTYVVTINYEDLSNTSKVIINPAPTKTVLSGVKNINVGDSLTVTATVNATTGSVTFKINSKTQTVDIVNNKASYTIADLSEGSYNIGVGYNDVSGNYLSSSDSASFTVSKISPKLSVIADDIGEGQDAIFEITTNEDCTGDISLLIDGKNYKNTLSNGKTIIKVPNLTTGDYNYTVSFLGDKKYGSKSINGNINVKSINVILNAPDLIKYYGSTDKLSAQLLDKSNKPLTGQKIIFTVNGRDYERITDNLGIASMNINLISGNHIANVRFEGNGTYDAIKTTVQIQIKSTVSGNDVTKIFRNGTQYYAKFVDTKGNLMKNTDVKFNINGVFYTRTTNDKGVAKMNINLPPGTYIITAENPNSTEKYTNVITVLPSIVENYDLTKYYKNASKYTLRIIGDDGKPVGEGVTVKLNINGVFYERKTNATGYINMNINLPPGTYTVTAEYNGLRASNKITVLSVLKTNDLVMKYKDGSKFEAKILDAQGKPYADQTVTFNINGVFYTKTTGADGIASLNINLLAGEYIITSMYNGLNAANKVTISR